jgi:hypothetical protein
MTRVISPFLLRNANKLSVMHSWQPDRDSVGRVAIMRVEVGTNLEDQVIDALAGLWLCLKLFATQITKGNHGPIIFKIEEAEIFL